MPASIHSVIVLSVVVQFENVSYQGSGFSPAISLFDSTNAPMGATSDSPKLLDGCAYRRGSQFYGLATARPKAMP